MHRPRHAALGLAVLLFAMAAHHSQGLGQPATYNYYSRSPEGEARLRSNEGHHLEKGIRHLNSGKPHEIEYAKKEFDFILGIWPNHPQVLALQAETLVRLRRPGLIDGYFERAYKVTPDVAQLRVTHGVALLRVDRVDDAIAQLQRGVELDDASVNAHYNLGLALVRAKRYEEANRHAQRAYALGHPLPGLRDQLKKAGAWKPDAEPLPADSPASKAR